MPGAQDELQLPRRSKNTQGKSTPRPPPTCSHPGPHRSSLPAPPLPAAGEFQFAFIAFLVGQSLEGFSQWKAFLHLLFGCDEAPLGMRAGLFTHFLAALRAQLVQSLVSRG